MTEANRQAVSMMKEAESIVFGWSGVLVASGGTKELYRELARRHNPSFLLGRIDLFRALDWHPDDILRIACAADDTTGIWQEAMQLSASDEYSKRPIEGAEESVRAIGAAGYRTVLLADTDRAMLRADAERVGFDLGVFDSEPIYTIPEYSKADPVNMYQVATRLDEYGIVPSASVYVGKSFADKKLASSSGMMFIGIEKHPDDEGFSSLPNATIISGIGQLALIAQNLKRRP